MFVSGRVGYTPKDAHTEGVGTEPRFAFPFTNIGLLDVPPELQRVTGYLTDSNTFVVVANRNSRLSTQVDATWYVRAWGEHAFKAGVQADWSANDVNSGYHTNTVGLNWNRHLGGVRGKYGYYVEQAMAQQHINTDARFLLPDAFQAPRTARVMLKWSF